MSEGDFKELENDISSIFPEKEKFKTRWLMNRVFEWLDSNGFEVVRKHDNG